MARKGRITVASHNLSYVVIVTFDGSEKAENGYPTREVEITISEDGKVYVRFDDEPQGESERARLRRELRAASEEVSRTRFATMRGRMHDLDTTELYAAFVEAERKHAAILTAIDENERKALELSNVLGTARENLSPEEYKWYSDEYSKLIG